ncbi:MAG: CorA family divalent cation transporter [Gammaproteobacteria bacterium]
MFSTERCIQIRVHHECSAIATFFRNHAIESDCSDMLEDPIRYQENLEAIREILLKQRLIEDLVHKQDMPRHELVESLVHKENLAHLQHLVNRLDNEEVAQMLKDLPAEDQTVVWEQLDDARKESMLSEMPGSVLQIPGIRDYKAEKSRVKAFDLYQGRLREISFETDEDLARTRPIWVDMVAPTFEDRIWVGEMFGIVLPDPDKLSDLESSARFYVEENGEIHLHSDFLLDKNDVSRNVAVAFILYRNILFSVRKDELPVFRLQRLRALAQPDYVSDSMDMLLDLYAANTEYSAGALEDVYRGLEIVGNHVLGKQISDDVAARILADIANEEDLNGRIRRNVMDTRRAVSFLMRGKLLTPSQLEYSQQILRDIESLDGHTAFLFDKINFLMDAIVGFININQNRVFKRLTVINVIFLPLNVLVGIGGMSEYTMMTEGIPWPVAYGSFSIGLILVGWITLSVLRRVARRESGRTER